MARLTDWKLFYNPRNSHPILMWTSTHIKSDQEVDETQMWDWRRTEDTGAVNYTIAVFNQKYWREISGTV